jgi:hypothetical protein
LIAASTASSAIRLNSSLDSSPACRLRKTCTNQGGEEDAQAGFHIQIGDDSPQPRLGLLRPLVAALQHDDPFFESLAVHRHALYLQPVIDRPGSVGTGMPRRFDPRHLGIGQSAVCPEVNAFSADPLPHA